METKRLYKLFWAWEFEEEEKWLNKMAQNGWSLYKAGFLTYDFEHREPGEYIIRMELTGAKNNTDYQDFLEETQVETAGQCAYWKYYRRKTSLGPFELFSDIESKIVHLGKIRRVLLAAACLNFGIGSLNIGLSPIALANYAVAILGATGALRVKAQIKVLQEEGKLHE